MDESKNIKRRLFIKDLLSLKAESNRGVLAELRRGFSPASETRAWPYIGRYCDLDDFEERIVFQTIAAGYATQPDNDEVPSANFGSVMRNLAGSILEPSPTFDASFRRILACNFVEDVCDRLKAPIKAAKAKGVAIPWKSLFWDLLYWESEPEEIKTKWAAKYWCVPRDCAPVEDDGVNDAEGNDE